MSFPMTSPPLSPCIFCEIARSSTTTATLLHSDEKVVAFEDINPSAFSQRSWIACFACPCEGEPLWNEKISPPGSIGAGSLQKWIRGGLENVFPDACIISTISSTKISLVEKNPYRVKYCNCRWKCNCCVLTIWHGRHYLVIPIEHIPTVRDLKRREEDYNLVTHMLKVGQTLLQRDAPLSKLHRFGFHQPPLNSVNHLHLHCLALPFIPKWKQVKYMPLGPFAGFIEAEKLLNRIKPE